MKYEMKAPYPEGSTAPLPLALPFLLRDRLYGAR
jgi:hypothetical protein